MTNDSFLKEMGKRIRQIRKSKKISLKKLQVLTELDDYNLMCIEHGRKSARILTLKSIADVLGVDVKDFL